MDGEACVLYGDVVFGRVSPVSYGLIPIWHLQRELYRVLRAVCNYHGSGCVHITRASILQLSNSASIRQVA